MPAASHSHCDEVQTSSHCLKSLDEQSLPVSWSLPHATCHLPHALARRVSALSSQCPPRMVPASEPLHPCPLGGKKPLPSSFSFSLYKFSAYPVSCHSSPFVVSLAFYCILNYSSVYLNLSSSSHWLWAPGKQDIVYCVHCWTPAPGTAPAQSKTLLTVHWSSIWMDMQNRLIMGGPWYSTLRKILNS